MPHPTTMAAAAPAFTLDSPAASAVARCLHCGEPCGDAALESDLRPFCCTGCRTVFGLLSDHGLTAFYACDPAAGLSQRSMPPPPPDHFAALDLPEVASAFTVAGAGGSLQATLAVPALHCAACVWLLEQLWRLDKGVRRSEVDLVRRVVRVDFDPQRTSLRQVAEVLARLGYAPSLDTMPSSRQAPTSRRSLYLKIGVAGFAFGNVMLFSIPRYANGAPLEPAFQLLFNVLNLVLATPVLLFSASDYFRGAAGAVRARTVTLDVPIALGLLALFGRSVFEIATGTGEGFLDSFAGLVFFLLIGRLFQLKAFEALAFDRSLRSFLPLSVSVERDERRAVIPIEALRQGDIMHVRAREVVPTDAVLLEGPGRIEYAFVTGEQAPVAVQSGDRVNAGGRVVGAGLRLLALRPSAETRLASMVEHSLATRSSGHWLTTLSATFGLWFTVVALGLAAVGAYAWWPDAGMSLQVATAVLIIACPCALTLSAPITLGTAMGVLGRRGWYLKDPAVLLDLARVDTILFDKTGTLTTSAPDVRLAGLGARRWRLVRRLAMESIHPVSRAIAAGSDAADMRRLTVSSLREVPHAGISGLVDGHAVAIGQSWFVSGRTDRAPRDAGHVTWAVVDGDVGRVTIATTTREGVTSMLDALAARFDLWLASGDHAGEAPRWQPWFANRLRFRQSPEDKLSLVRDRQALGHRVLVVGDGLNDAVALTSADVGLAVSDDTACVVPACHAIVRGTELANLPIWLGYARRARRVIALCFVVSIVYNAIGLWLALTGYLTPLATAVLMPVSSLTVIGLSVGLMRWRSPKALTA